MFTTQAWPLPVSFWTEPREPKRGKGWSNLRWRRHLHPRQLRVCLPRWRLPPPVPGSSSSLDERRKELERGGPHWTRLSSRALSHARRPGLWGAKIRAAHATSTAFYKHSTWTQNYEISCCSGLPRSRMPPCARPSWRPSNAFLRASPCPKWELYLCCPCAGRLGGIERRCSDSMTSRSCTTLCWLRWSERRPSESVEPQRRCAQRCGGYSTARR